MLAFGKISYEDIQVNKCSTPIVYFGFFALYVLPVMAYVFLYGRVVLTLYRRKTSTDLNRSAVVDAAQAATTKTAVTLTAICLFAIGFSAWYYVLGNTGVIEFEAGGYIDRLGQFSRNVNPEGKSC